MWQQLIKPFFFTIAFLSEAVTAHAAPQISVHRDPPHIQMPKAGDLPVNIHPSYSNVLEFSGPIDLEGKLNVYWYEYVIDSEGPSDSITETRLGLDFYPNAASLAKLPVVGYEDEPEAKAVRIRLNDLTHRQTEGLILLFGFRQAKEMLQNKKNLSFDGVLTVDVYRTFFECNARYFEANVGEFRAHGEPVELTKTPDAKICEG